MDERLLRICITELKTYILHHTKTFFSYACSNSIKGMVFSRTVVLHCRDCEFHVTSACHVCSCRGLRIFHTSASNSFSSVNLNISSERIKFQTYPPWIKPVMCSDTAAASSLRSSVPHPARMLVY